MKKTLCKFLIPTILFNLIAYTLPLNLDVISFKNNIDEVKNEESSNKEENDKHWISRNVMKNFIENLITNDCSNNFQKHYRLKAKEFKPITYVEIVKEFQQYLCKKYAFNFNVEVAKTEEDNYLITGANKINIKISLFQFNDSEINWNYVIMILKINLNDTAFKLLILKYKLENNCTEFTKDKTFEKNNELVSYLNEVLSKTKLWSEVKVEETVFPRKDVVIHDINGYDLKGFNDANIGSFRRRIELLK